MQEFRSAIEIRRAIARTIRAQDARGRSLHGRLTGQTADLPAGGDHGAMRALLRGTAAGTRGGPPGLRAEIVRLHLAERACAALVLALADQGNVAAAQGLLSGRYLQISQTLMRRLRQWDRTLRPRSGAARDRARPPVLCSIDRIG